MVLVFMENSSFCAKKHSHLVKNLVNKNCV